MLVQCCKVAQGFDLLSIAKEGDSVICVKPVPVFGPLGGKGIKILLPS